MSDLDFSNAVISDRLRAFARGIDSDTLPGRLQIYSAPRPAVGATPVGATLLVSCEFPHPCVDTVLGTTMTLLEPDTALIQASGEANWARFVNGAGAFVADANVGLPGSGMPIEIDNGQTPKTLLLYTGGDFTLILAQLAEA